MNLDFYISQEIREPREGHHNGHYLNPTKIVINGTQGTRVSSYLQDWLYMTAASTSNAKFKITASFKPAFARSLGSKQGQPSVESDPKT